AVDSTVYASPLPHIPPASDLLLRRKAPGGGAILGGFDAAPSADSMMYGAYNGGFGMARPAKHILLNNAGVLSQNIPKNMPTAEDVVVSKFASLMGENMIQQPIQTPQQQLQTVMVSMPMPLVGHQVQNFDGIITPLGQLPQPAAPSPVGIWQPNF